MDKKKGKYNRIYKLRSFYIPWVRKYNNNYYKSFVNKSMYLHNLLVYISNLNYSLNCELINALKYGESMYVNQFASKKQVIW